MRPPASLVLGRSKWPPPSAGIASCVSASLSVLACASANGARLKGCPWPLHTGCCESGAICVAGACISATGGTVVTALGVVRTNSACDCERGRGSTAKSARALVHCIGELATDDRWSGCCSWISAIRLTVPVSDCRPIFSVGAARRGIQSGKPPLLGHQAPTQLAPIVMQEPAYASPVQVVSYP
ncbi:hypothetical protein IGB42_02342 [Andreprevotia sp. IGB-42]|nr:hypothetical protein IGB42_02342 [Andreprevotia sp. IGB-42]